MKLSNSWTTLSMPRSRRRARCAERLLAVRSANRQKYTCLPGRGAKPEPSRAHRAEHAPEPPAPGKPRRNRRWPTRCRLRRAVPLPKIRRRRNRAQARRRLGHRLRSAAPSTRRPRHRAKTVFAATDSVRLGARRRRRARAPERRVVRTFGQRISEDVQDVTLTARWPCPSRLEAKGPRSAYRAEIRIELALLDRRRVLAGPDGPAAWCCGQAREPAMLPDDGAVPRARLRCSCSEPVIGRCTAPVADGGPRSFRTGRSSSAPPPRGVARVGATRDRLARSAHQEELMRSASPRPVTTATSRTARASSPVPARRARCGARALRRRLQPCHLARRARSRPCRRRRRRTHEAGQALHARGPVAAVRGLPRDHREPGDRHRQGLRRDAPVREGQELRGLPHAGARARVRLRPREPREDRRRALRQAAGPQPRAAVAARSGLPRARGDHGALSAARVSFKNACGHRVPGLIGRARDRGRAARRAAVAGEDTSV